MANNIVDYSKYETLRQRLQNEFLRRKYNGAVNNKTIAFSPAPKSNNIILITA